MRRAGLSINSLMAAGWIRSVQRLAITIPNGQTSASGTIIAINPTHTFVRCQGSRNSGVDNVALLPYASAYTATSVTAIRPANDASNSSTLEVEVVELQPGAVRSIQHVAVNFVSANPIVTIAAVDPAMTFLVWRGTGLNQTTAASYVQRPTVKLKSSTEVEGAIGASSSEYTSYVTVVELHKWATW